MLNAEKYKDEILKVKDNEGSFSLTKYNEIRKCCDGSCSDCIFFSGNCYKEILRWLLSEYKEPVELTEDEYYFCKLMKKGYLVRDSIGELQYFFVKPERISNERISNGWWGNYTYLSDFEQLKDLFTFIENDTKELYSIEELLGTCAVKEENTHETDGK